MTAVLKLLFNHKSQLLAGLVLNVALMVYVYIIVDGGAVQHKKDWLSLLNEMPITVVFFLAAILKPYLMVWWRCRKNVDVIASAGTVMLVITAIACVIALNAGSALAKDLAMYINWAFLWAASTYFVLLPQRSFVSE